MELRDYLDLLRRRWLVVLVTGLIGAVLAYGATDRTARYDATATVLVGPQRIDFTSDVQGSGLNQDRIIVIDRLLLTYSNMIRSRTVAQAALVRLELDRSPGSIVGAIQTRVVPETQLLQITATDTNPGTARDLANAVAGAFVEEVGAFGAAEDGSEGVVPSGIPVAVFEEAQIPVLPQPTGLLGNTILGLLFGCILGSGGLITTDALDVRVRTAADAERRLGVPVLGVIPRLPNSEQLTAISRANMRRAARSVGTGGAKHVSRG